jgi:hypothetical protein
MKIDTLLAHNIKRMRPLGRPRCRWIILKWQWKNNVIVWNAFSWLRMQSVMGCHELQVPQGKELPLLYVVHSVHCNNYFPFTTFRPTNCTILCIFLV